MTTLRLLASCGGWRCILQVCPLLKMLFGHVYQHVYHLYGMSRGLAVYHSFTSFFLVMFSFISAWMPCCVSAQHKSICIVCHVVRVVAAANSHQCPLKLPNYLIMSLSDSTVINAGVSVEAANHLSLFLTTPGSTATSNQVLHKIVIVDQVGFHLVPLSAKSV